MSIFEHKTPLVSIGVIRCPGENAFSVLGANPQPGWRLRSGIQSRKQCLEI